MVRRRTGAIIIIVAVALVGACGLGLYMWDERREQGGPWHASGPGRPGGPAGAAAGSSGQDEPSSGPEGAGLEARLEEGALPGANIVLEGTKIVVPGPSGEVEWSFAADKIEMAASEKVVRLTGVEGARHTSGGLEVRIRAGRLTANLESGRLEFESGVQVTTGRNSGFSARSALWDPKARKFTAFGDVKYRDGEASISGNELYADAELKVASVKGSVRFSTTVKTD